MNRRACAFCIAAFLALTSQADAANKAQIPSNAKPLTQRQTFIIYANHTIDYGTFKYYFYPDGRLVGYTTNLKSFASGSWGVNNNSICIESTWKTEDKSYSSTYITCNEWYSKSGIYWTKITKCTVPTYIGNVYAGNVSTVATGNQVSRYAKQIKEKFGY